MIRKLIIGQSNYAMVQEQLLQADVFVYEMYREIQGFMGIVDNYIAGIFVDKKYRSLGVGKQLLNDAKQKYRCLSLSVYQKIKELLHFISERTFQYYRKALIKQPEKPNIQ